MTAVLVIIGAAVGAPARYLLDRSVQAWHTTRFPWGTFAVNMVGCFILGTLAGASARLPGEVGALLGTGFCGALTTYSTFGFETVRLAETGAKDLAAAYALGSVVTGVGMAFLGVALGSPE